MTNQAGWMDMVVIAMQLPWVESIVVMNQSLGDRGLSLLDTMTWILMNLRIPELLGMLVKPMIRAIHREGHKYPQPMRSLDAIRMRMTADLILVLIRVSTVALILMPTRALTHVLTRAVTLRQPAFPRTGTILWWTVA
jgi:hypothetical protein